MKNVKEKRLLAAACVLSVIAVIFTILVVTVDVAPIGLMESKVGFAGINGRAAQALPFNKGWYTLSKVVGILALLVAAGFAVVGVMQLIQEKSLRRVDRMILALGVLYLIVLVLYVSFNKLALNYRPVDLGEGLEPSYPSTHTLLAFCILGSAMMAIDSVFASPRVCLVFRIAFAVGIVLIVVGRLLSGVHWVSDIVGGVLISSALLLFFAAFKAAKKN